MRARAWLLPVALAAGAWTGGATPQKPSGAAVGSKLERLAEKMLPQKKLNDALGFFGPVTKKYLPTFKEFNGAYLAGTNKIAVVRQYLPLAQAALDEAKAMRIPAKYEAEKAEYIRMAETFLTVLRITVRLSKHGD